MSPILSWHVDCTNRAKVKPIKTDFRMRKIFTTIFIALLGVVIFTGCSKRAQWNRAQRQSMREALREYRQAAYLNDLTDAEFTLFTDDVATSLEKDYPVYTTFVKMPGSNDTVHVYVVTTIVKELNADVRNMRHIFPYSWLVSNNILPSGLDRSQQQAFYNCLAAKVDNQFPTMKRFVNAMMKETTDTSLITRLQRQCANDLFGWTVVIEEEEIVDL